MLALERKATVMSDGENVRVRAQPFGGSIRILDPPPLQELIGEIKFDSERSQYEQDFRILIPPSQWEAVKQFCLQHLQNPNGTVLESSPQRELTEEFAETLNIDLKPDQYTHQTLGFVIGNDPVPTDNVYARGQPTVRLYRIFEVTIHDDGLRSTMLTASEHYSDQDLEILALKDFQNGGRGRANAILTLPLRLVTESYLVLSPELRTKTITVENHQLDESVLAILENIDAPQYQVL